MASVISRSLADIVQSAPETMCTLNSVPVHATPGIRKATML